MSTRVRLGIGVRLGIWVLLGLDLVSPGLTDSYEVYANDGVTKFTWCRSIAGTVRMFLSVADIDGDGHDDLVTPGEVFFGPLSNDSIRSMPLPSDGYLRISARTGDFDHDGKPDVSVGYDNNGVRITLNSCL